MRMRIGVVAGVFGVAAALAAPTAGATVTQGWMLPGINLGLATN